MSDPIPLQTPGGFAPVVALGHDDGTGNLSVVARTSPLPVHAAPPDAPDPLAGQTAADLVVGPFTPTAMSPVFCTLSGDWQGSVEVKRSIDGGATLHPLTVAGSAWGSFTANACEPVWEESEAGASLWLDCRILSGTLAYRLAQ